MWFVNAGMSPRNHRFPLSCARQDMNVGRVFTFLINAFNFDNWGCAAAALLNVYLQLMCWKKDDITCCSARTGQQAKVDLVQASHWAFPALSLENERKEPGFSCILCEKGNREQHSNHRPAPAAPMCPSVTAGSCWLISGFLGFLRADPAQLLPWPLSRQRCTVEI